MSTPAGYVLALILFFGRGRGRGGRATAKPTVSRRSSADGFAVKMKRTKAGGQDYQILFPVFGGEMATAKIQTIKGKSGFFRTHEKNYSALTVWIVGTDIERGLLVVGRCAILKLVRTCKQNGKLLIWEIRQYEEF